MADVDLVDAASRCYTESFPPGALIAAQGLCHPPPCVPLFYQSPHHTPGKPQHTLVPFNAVAARGSVSQLCLRLFGITNVVSAGSFASKVDEFIPQIQHVNLSMVGQLLSRNVERFRGGLVLKAHILLYHSTLGSRVIKKKKSRLT